MRQGNEKELMGRGKQNGYSLLEMIITVSILLILAAVTFTALQPALTVDHVDSAYTTTIMALRNTRNLAITQSHEYYVNFNPTGFATGTIQIEYQPPAATPGGTLPAIEQVITYTIPSDVKYGVLTGFPASAPDGFGTGIAPIDFGQGLGGGSLNYVVFMPDGSSRDSLGNYNNGVIYLTNTASNIMQSRAISVWGATGRICGWRLTPSGSGYEWVQQ
jgi:prepilin-type N-terminal cleavage/methylation domain-containing protein